MNLPKFSLTRLPVPCAKNVLQTMSSFQLVAFSLLSKKCKNQAISLNIPTKPMAILFTQGLVITVRFQQEILRIGFYEPHSQEEIRNKIQLGIPKNVSIGIIRNGIYIEERIWNTNRLGVREWIDHIQLIFPNSESTWLNFLAQSFQFDLDSVKETFPIISKLTIEHTGNFEYNQLIFQKLFPTEVVSISPNCFRDSRIPHRILIQNFSKLNYIGGPLANITLNDLLINNSKRIGAPNSQISSKEFNKFLKLWIKGGNPRMEFLTVSISDGIVLDIIMKGIKYQKMPKTLKRMYKFGRIKVLTLSGGLDIYRMDGTKATMGVFRKEDRWCFTIFVWHDHCNAQ